MIKQNTNQPERRPTMAEEPKPNTDQSTPPPADGAEQTTPSTDPNATPATPSPEDTKPPGDAAAATGGPIADALSDGTTPTVLKTGDIHRPVAKGKSSITSIYRRADILTTLFTFVGAVVAALLIVGVYAYFTRNKTTTNTTPKVTTLSKADLDKLGAFFNGNSAGNSSQVLTVSSSSLFNNRVAIASDLKVIGGVQVSGGTALADLTVDKTSTLGITNIRGALTVSGTTNLQSPAILGGGATVNGNVAVSGNGSFGGSISAGVINVSNITVSGALNLNGHLNIGGSTPTVSPNSDAGTGATASVTGNDTAGTITITTGSNALPTSLLVALNFRTAYPNTPRVLITPVGLAAGTLPFYTIKSSASFSIGAGSGISPSRTYSWDYWVIQ